VNTLGNGDDGEAIGFYPNDGLIYHASGNDTLGAEPLLQVFESINPLQILPRFRSIFLAPASIMSKRWLPKPRTDFDADVKNDSGAYRNGIWFIRRSLDGAVISVGLGGAASDVAVPPDYDGENG
jgi:hypothetical protein